MTRRAVLQPALRHFSGCIAHAKGRIYEINRFQDNSLGIATRLCSLGSCSVSAKHALVTGVGPGTGAAVVRRFAEAGYQVTMLARSEERLRKVEKEVYGCAAYPVDVTDTPMFLATLDRICAERGDPEIVIHNAVGGTIGTFDTIDPAHLQRNFNVNVMAFLHLARRLTPAMVVAGRGVLIASGNTSALRGKPLFAAFAPSKAAQRILAESIAREIGPKGVHVGYLIIDAVIDLEWTRKIRPDEPDDFFIKPAHIADEIFRMAHQPKGAWSFNVEVRPFGEELVEEEDWCVARDTVCCLAHAPGVFPRLYAL